MTGNFAHNPEPLKEHLTELCTTVTKNKATLGIAVDPDVDRLCFVSEERRTIWRRIYFSSCS
jgi:phosphomannomutase